MNVRPRRSATLRTRLDVEQVRQRVIEVAREGEPDGSEIFISHSYFLGGSVGERDFDLDYRFNSARNPQTYSVVGTIQDTHDWRVVRLKIKAHSPWMGWWVFGGIVLFVAFAVLAEDLPPWGGVAGVGVAVALAALANLLYVPDVVTSRVCVRLAGALRGSVLQKGKWVVPPAP